MSSELSHEQHADRGLQEEAKGVLADKTVRDRQPETKREHGQYGKEATSAGETIQGDSSRSEHWSSGKSSNPQRTHLPRLQISAAEPYTSFRQEDADDDKTPFEPRNEAAAKAAEANCLSQVGAIFTTPEGHRTSEKQSGEQSGGAINTSTTQPGPHETSRLKELRKWVAAATNIGERLL